MRTVMYALVRRAAASGPVHQLSALAAAALILASSIRAPFPSNCGVGFVRVGG